MMPRPGPILLLCLLPALGWAAEQRPASCGGAIGDKPFTPTVSRTLSRAEASQLGRLFRGLDGQWHGTLIETVCMLSGVAVMTKTMTP